MNIEGYTQEVTNELINLLLLADPNREAVMLYIRSADILVARDEKKLIGVGVLVKNNDHHELRNLAVVASYRGRGVGIRLIQEIKALARKRGASILEVGTGNSSLLQLALYQKSGFRMHSIEQNYFGTYPEPIIENGIHCLDLVRMQVKL